MGTIDSAKYNKSSPKAPHNARASSREASVGKGGAPSRSMQPYNSNENNVAGGMNSLLKSPIKNNLH